LEVEKMTARRKDRLGMGLLWIVHLVCCGLLLIFLVGGISIGMVTSYLLESLVPVGIVVGVIVIGWTTYHLWGRHRLKRFDNLAKSPSNIKE
jgi:cytochrome c biogenesis protein CcdA